MRILRTEAVLLAAEPGMQDIVRILNGVRNLLVGILVALAVAALTYAGVRYVVSGGDPMSVEKAEAILRKRQSQLVSQSLGLSVDQSVGQLRRDHPAGSGQAGKSRNG